MRISFEKIFSQIKYFIQKHIIINFSKKFQIFKLLAKISAFLLVGVKIIFLSIIHKPKKSKHINIISTSKNLENEFAIILQGPIDNEENFTLETIRIYKKIFPNARIILSTWENENINQIRLIQKENIDLIQNKIPRNSGTGNINLQLKSTSAGIELAKSEGIKYTLKQELIVEYINQIRLII